MNNTYMHELSVSSNAKENSIILQKPVEYLNLKSKALLRFVGSTLTSSSTTLTILLKLNIELLQKKSKVWSCSFRNNRSNPNTCREKLNFEPFAKIPSSEHGGLKSEKSAVQLAEWRKNFKKWYICSYYLEFGTFWYKFEAV